MSYDNDRVIQVLEELESHSDYLSNPEISNVYMAREYTDTGKEVPRWLLVRLASSLKKIRGRNVY